MSGITKAIRSMGSDFVKDVKGILNKENSSEKKVRCLAKAVFKFLAVALLAAAVVGTIHAIPLFVAGAAGAAIAKMALVFGVMFLARESLAISHDDTVMKEISGGEVDITDKANQKINEKVGSKPKSYLKTAANWIKKKIDGPRGRLI